jgi:hypothetical protein
MVGLFLGPLPREACVTELQLVSWRSIGIVCMQQAAILNSAAAAAAAAAAQEKRECRKEAQ